MADAAYASLPFNEQADFFRRKVNLPTTGWIDIYTAEHDWAFVVAGANRDAIVSDFRAAVDRAILDGTTLETFRKDFDRIVTTHGWDYNGGRDWRSRVIYDTNLSTSYAAGRWEQLQDAPFWQYVHQDWVQHPRPLHQAWNGLVLTRENQWWLTHFPPNGWGCHCEVRGLWPEDLERLGKSGPDQAPSITWEIKTIGQRSERGPIEVNVPQGIDPGFEYAPGQARLAGAIPPPRAGGPAGPAGTISESPARQPLDPLPLPRIAPPGRIMSTGLSQEEYVAGFLESLNAPAGTPTIVRDALNERLVVGREMFQAGDRQLLLPEAAEMLPLVARLLVEPDEIWVRVEWAPSLNKAVVRRRYVARYLLPGKDEPALLILERDTAGWSSMVNLQAGDQSADAWRQGVRLYQRETD